MFRFKKALKYRLVFDQSALLAGAAAGLIGLLLFVRLASPGFILGKTTWFDSSRDPMVHVTGLRYFGGDSDKQHAPRAHEHSFSIAVQRSLWRRHSPGGDSAPPAWKPAGVRRHWRWPVSFLDRLSRKTANVIPRKSVGGVATGMQTDVEK
jgi:hypothetical protein